MFILRSGNWWGPGDGCVQLTDLVVRFVKVNRKESHSTLFCKQDDRWRSGTGMNLSSLFCPRILCCGKEKTIPLYFVFLMPLGFSPAGFYSLLLASQIRRMLAYFKFPRIQQPLINRKLMFWNVTKIRRWNAEVGFILPAFECSGVI